MDPFSTRWSSALQVARQTQNGHSRDLSTVGQGGRGNRLGCGRRLRRKDQLVLTWRRGDARCTQAVRDHFYAYGRTRGVPFHPCAWSEELKGPVVPQGLDLYCSDFCGCSKDSSPYEHYQLFLVGWKEGAAQAEQVYAQRDLDRDVRILAVLLVSRAIRSPRNYPWVSAWRDGAEAKLHGEVFRRFIRGWLQIGVDRRRVKGVRVRIKDVTLFELIFMGEVVVL